VACRIGKNFAFTPPGPTAPTEKDHGIRSQTVSYDDRTSGLAREPQTPSCVRHFAALIGSTVSPLDLGWGVRRSCPNFFGLDGGIRLPVRFSRPHPGITSGFPEALPGHNDFGRARMLRQSAESKRRFAHSLSWGLGSVASEALSDCCCEMGVYSRRNRRGKCRAGATPKEQ